ncbi:hypothetical protein [Acinetobacter soli]|uniref:Uncharacterized protein n=2 Tax=Acinetobacter soli TaxID=487316 RepID=A0AB38YW91_9GAMM|nr:hypothetical protein [Acinetobacter soli]KQC94429.1 hypothetical protein APD01_15730 [Acinetobacter soli]MCB8768737.1 hypothetical protein [Acinetobacter soli]MDQ8942850.1 hypothetical protein [Acinetobacter soli]MEB4800971.1 hypothetical protein [Acinetobacter soli]WND05752.1 hypothetical protein RHP80_00850 [Acinetobacter soli]
MKQLKAILLTAAGLCLTQAAFADRLTSLDDQQMSEVTGQALLNLNYVAPGGSNPNGNMGFYRLGLEAQLELNANIKKLQLGCGGVKGTGCDIDIDNIALTGITSSTAQGAGVGTDFKLTNPFIEFAIQNPDSAATRTITGFRLGALSALGIMNIGSNGDLNTLADDTGINSLSGDIGVRVTNAKINDVRATVLGLGLLRGSATIDSYSTTLLNNRDSTFSLTKMTAQASPSLLSLKLTNVNMNDIPYRTVHQLLVADTDSNGNLIATSNAYISSQSKDIFWQNVSNQTWASNAAKQGWWISIPQTQFNNLSIDQTVNISVLSALPGALLGTPVNLAPVDLGQMPISNCYGNLKFC